MFSFGTVFVIALIALPIVMTVLHVIYEPRRKRDILLSLSRQKDWMFGRDISRQTGVRVAYVTLASLEDAGLVERQTFDDPGGMDRGFLPRTRYRLTDNGRAAAERTDAMRQGASR